MEGDTTTQAPPGEPADLVLDTNVGHEIFGGFREVFQESEKCSTLDEMLSDPMFRYRVARARASICLIWLCHKRRWTTVCHIKETVDLLVNKVPPKATTPPTIFAKMMLHFVQPQVLPGWSNNYATEEDQTLSGEDVDDALLSIAVKQKLPLVTNEGFSWAGHYTDVNTSGRENLRGKARAAGVRVGTPSEFLQDEGLSLEALGKAFFGALMAARKPADFECSDGNLRILRTLYRFVLLERLPVGVRER